jgi:hypothetical protein
LALISQTHLKSHETFFIPNYHFCRTDRFQRRTGGTAVAVRKGIPHNHADLPLLVSTEATGVCILVGNSEVLLAAVYKLSGNAWSDVDITELLSFRHKLLLAGDLNDKYPFCNDVVSNSSGLKLLNLLDKNMFETSAPRCPTHYSPAGNGDVLDISVHNNVRLSEVIVSDILNSDHLPIIFHLLDRIRTRNLTDPLEKFTDW